MSMTWTFCDERARGATEAAEQAELVNVRERELRSAAAWHAMADQIKKTDRAREEKERVRLDAIALEAAKWRM